MTSPRGIFSSPEFPESSKLLRIGLTGGIGAGKSTVAQRFAARDVPVIDADEIAHAVTAPGGRAYGELVANFGDAFFLDDGTLDRARLRAHVFANPDARRMLEGIVHPHVRVEINARLRAVQAPYCLIVIPLLFESHMEDSVNRVLTIEAQDKLRVQRVMTRSALTESDVRAIMAAQLPPADRMARANDIVSNDSSPDALDAAVEKLHRQYLDLARSHRP